MPDQTDPSKMSDEELDKAIAGEELEEQEEEENKEEDGEQPKPGEQEEELEEEQPEKEEDEKPASRRENLRIQQLLDRIKEDSPRPKPVESLDYEKELDADEETLKRLQTDRDTTGQQYYQQGLDQAKSLMFRTRLEIDAPKVEAKHPELDKDSDKFNPTLADAINRMYLSTVGFQPGDEKKGTAETVQDAGLRYSTYVESIFELATEIAGEQTQESKKNITKQASKMGIRPDGSSAKKLNLNKHPGDMTDEELDAMLASQGLASKKR